MSIYPSLQEFVRLSKRANVIPVWTELLADLETPVSAFLKLDDGQHGFLLESVEGEEKLARFSFLGSQPRLIVQSRGRHMEIEERVGTRWTAKCFDTRRDPLAEIETLMRRYRTVTLPGLPRFCGGLVGYLGYDVVRFIERLPQHQRDPLRMPDLILMLTDSMVVFDHAQHKMLVLVNAFLDGENPAQAYRESVKRLHALTARLAKPLAVPRGRRRAARPSVTQSNLTPATFEKMVTRAKTYIRDGDIIQAVLSQRFERRVRCAPLDVYRALRSLNPSPYMFFLRFGKLALVGASPEMLVRCEDGVIETRPIAGTRRRGATAQEDDKLIRQLLKSPKERAEHLMLVDLGRNDLGRVAQVGTVETPEVMVIEKYSHVMHLVSGVRAKLKPGKTSFDVLRAAFPAGTVTGAPKVRAMEIIAELERDDRGPYAGAVGYFGFSGNLDTCITIRTVLMKDGVASVQAGAGIVADSNPKREYQETVNKAAGMLKAIERAEAGV